MSHQTIELTTANFPTTVLQSDLPVLVDFTAEWCPPCKMIAPYLDELAQKYTSKLIVGSLDVDVHPDIMQQYGVMGLPTLILFQNGQPITHIVGFQTRDRLESQILPHLQTELTP